jgi:hypothetical protein
MNVEFKLQIQLLDLRIQSFISKQKEISFQQVDTIFYPKHNPN